MSTYKERIRQAMGGGDISTDAMRGFAKHLGVSYQAVKKLVDPDGGSNTLSAENNSRAARHLGVSPDWLATGEGEMLAAAPQIASTEPDEVLAALRILAGALTAADKATRSAVAASFSLLASEPDQLENVVATLTKLLPDSHQTARNSQDDRSTGIAVRGLGTGGFLQDEQRNQVSARQGKK
jgi:hypothetical protein